MNSVKDDIETLKNTLDTILIECSKNTAHLQTLTTAFFELSHHLLNKDELSNLKSHFYHTLYEKSAQLLNDPDFLYHPAKAQFALFELKSFVNKHLKDLDK